MQGSPEFSALEPGLARRCQTHPGLTLSFPMSEPTFSLSPPCMKAMSNSRHRCLKPLCSTSTYKRWPAQAQALGAAGRRTEGFLRLGWSVVLSYHQGLKTREPVKGCGPHGAFVMSLFKPHITGFERPLAHMIIKTTAKLLKHLLAVSLLKGPRLGWFQHFSSTPSGFLTKLANKNRFQDYGWLPNMYRRST